MFDTLLFLFYLLTLDASATNTLSTRSKVIDDIVRPSSTPNRWNYLSDLVVKSINEQALYNDSMTYRKNDYNVRDERLSEIWNWDYWCKMQPVVGTCDENIPRYYFDLKTELCKPISYSGCNGGKNLFETKRECEKTCAGANDMLKPSIKLTDQLDCSYQPDPGVCLGYEEQLFYDVNLETCRIFIYGGCGGNGNRFNNIYECLRSCKETQRRVIKDNEAINY